MSTFNSENPTDIREAVYVQNFFEDGQRRYPCMFDYVSDTLVAVDFGPDDDPNEVVSCEEYIDIGGGQELLDFKDLETGSVISSGFRRPGPPDPDEFPVPFAGSTRDVLHAKQRLACRTTT